MTTISVERAEALARQVPVSPRYQFFLMTLLSDPCWLDNSGGVDADVLPAGPEFEALIDGETAIHYILRRVSTLTGGDVEREELDLDRLAEIDRDRVRRSVLAAFRAFVGLAARWRDGSRQPPVEDAPDRIEWRRFVASLDVADLRDGLDAAVALMAFDRIVRVGSDTLEGPSLIPASASPDRLKP